MANFALVADFTKKDSKQHIVEGFSTTSSLDRDNQIIDPEFLKNNYKQWAEKFGNIRYMHQATKVVGKVLSCSDWNPEKQGFYITAKITDPDVWNQIDQGLLNSFSVGIKNAKVVPDNFAKGGRLVSGEVIETSVVDIGSNRDSDFMVVKSASFDGDSQIWLDDDADEINGGDDMNDIDLSWTVDGMSDDDIDVYKRYYSDKERKDMPESDFAGPHRSFPIHTQEDVENAAHLIGHAKNPEAVKHRIIEIAHRKGFSIPDAWKEDANKTIDTSSGLQPHNLEGDDDKKEATKTVTPEEIKAAVEDTMRNVMEGMVTSLTEIRAQIEAMASQSDPDKDGDIDNVNHPEAEAVEDKTGGEPVNAASNDAPNAVQDFLDNALKTATADILSKVEAMIDEKFNTVTKSAVAENDSVKSLLNGIQDVVKTMESDIKKYAERLEVVEQSAAPAKGVTMVVDKFANPETQSAASESEVLADVTKTVRANYPNATPKFLSQMINEEMAKRQKGGNK